MCCRLIPWWKDWPQELAPLDCVTGEENRPFAVRTRLLWSKQEHVNHTDDVAIDFTSGDTVANDGPAESSSQQRASGRRLQGVVLANDAEIKYEPQTIEKHEQVSLHFTEHFPQTVQRIACLQQETEGRKTLKEDSQYSAAHTDKRVKRTDSVNDTQEPAPRLTTDIGKDDDITRDRLATVTIKGGESYRPQMQPNQADNLHFLRIYSFAQLVLYI